MQVFHHISKLRLGVDFLFVSLVFSLLMSLRSLFLEYKLKIQSIGVSNGLCCIFYLTVSSHLKVTMTPNSILHT